MERAAFKILVAEDDPGAQALYAKVLKKEGYEAVIVETGSQVTAELEAGRYDLLISDLKLKGTSASEYLPEVRKKFTGLPILVVSGYYSHLLEDFCQKGFEVDLFINKPLGLDDLKWAVRRLLGLSAGEGTEPTGMVVEFQSPKKAGLKGFEKNSFSGI